ncbi:MAG: TetR/AcrR family transcriptional regulator [Reyranellaceae bacterium]
MSKAQKPDGDRTRDRVLEAAGRLFGLYGFRRTTLADIAREAGLSRQSVYSRFAGKEAVLTALAEYLKQQALAAAAAAWRDEATLADNLAATVLAKDLPLYRLLHASPHGADLLAVDGALTAAVAAELERRFTALLARRLEAVQRGGASLAPYGGSRALARTLARAAGGLKAEASGEAAYVAEVQRLCRLAGRAIVG